MSEFQTKSFDQVTKKDLTLLIGESELPVEAVSLQKEKQYYYLLLLLLLLLLF